MITVDLPKAKEIAHKHRRAKRAELFQPLDVEATVPHLAAQAEAKRAKIREVFDAHQEAIDKATCPDTLKAALLAVKGV